MEKFERSLHIGDQAFDGMREDIDRTLQRLVKNMLEKGSLEGKLTISLEVEFEQEHIPNHNPAIKGETRVITSPKFSHKVGSIMQIKNEVKGGIDNNGMELVWDDELGEYILKPVADTEQCTIFDVDYDVVHDEYDYDSLEEIEGSQANALPDPEEDDDEGYDDFEDDGYGFDERD